MIQRDPRSGAREVQPGILFISHDAWRTGAPTVLLHFLRWFKANADVPFLILLREGLGELRPDFERLAPVFAWNEMGGDRFPIRVGRWGMSRARRRFIDDLTSWQIGLIYSNTITNGEVLEALADPGRPVVTHVHELEYWIRNRINAADVERCRRYTSRFVAVSQAVMDNMVSNLRIPAEDIDVIYDFITADSRPVQEQPVSLRERLGIPKEAFVVCGAGTTDWRKGPDLFVQLAALVSRPQRARVAYFVWVGGEHEGPDFAALWHDVRRAGIADRVHFVGRQVNILDYFEACDVFAMVSREDPFPLVCLEAASRRKPIVCFEGSGGAREFVEDDAGMVVPYLDLNAMAKAIHCLLHNPRLRSELGGRGAEKVRSRHDVSVAGPQILNVIRRFLPTVVQQR
jgi:glycosyltransferase involved in cell wall biosynthesis